MRTSGPSMPEILEKTFLFFDVTKERIEELVWPIGKFAGEVLPPALSMALMA